MTGIHNWKNMLIIRCCTIHNSFFSDAYTQNLNQYIYIYIYIDLISGVPTDGRTETVKDLVSATCQQSKIFGLKAENSELPTVSNVHPNDQECMIMAR